MKKYKTLKNECRDKPLIKFLKCAKNNFKKLVKLLKWDEFDGWIVGRVICKATFLRGGFLIGWSSFLGGRPVRVGYLGNAGFKPIHSFRGGRYNILGLG